MADLGGKIAIVTGASRGLGAVIAERLAGDGFTVVINYVSSNGPAEELVRKIEAAGGNARAEKADVSDPAAVRRMFDAVEAAYGGVDVLVNNAGIITLGNIGDMDDDAFGRLVAVNLTGTFNTLREAATRLRRGGRIINFSSSVTALQRPTYGPYAATKAAVETLTRIMSMELRDRDITVNAVKLPATAVASAPGMDRDAAGELRAAPPLERPGRPEDVAALVSFLAGSDAGWITGRSVRSHGGHGVERLITPPSPPAWHRTMPGHRFGEVGGRERPSV